MKPPPVVSAALHEAGHSLILAPFNIRTSAYIEGSGECWGGRTYIIGADRSECPPNWRQLIGAAGFLAELIGYIRPDADEHLAFAWLQFKMTCSPTDTAYMQGLTVGDVRDCLMILRILWPDVLARAHQLIKDCPDSA